MDNSVLVSSCKMMEILPQISLLEVSFLGFWMLFLVPQQYRCLNVLLDTLGIQVQHNALLHQVHTLSHSSHSPGWPAVRLSSKVFHPPQTDTLHQTWWGLHTYRVYFQNNIYK